MISAAGSPPWSGASRGESLQSSACDGAVVAHEERHRCVGEDVPLPVLGERGEAVDRVGTKIDGRVHEQLEPQLGATPVAGQQRQHGGEVATSAVAPDGDARRISAQLGSVGGHPLEHRPGVVERSRERVLGCQSVVHRDHDDTRVGAEGAAGVIVGVEAPDGPAATVEVDQDPEGPRAGGRVHAHRDVAPRSRDRPVGRPDVGPRR
jgi:hypothetical protein